jgi:hypothetical protein
MALVLPHSVFFHLPKTGGSFIRKTIKDLGIENREVGGHHESLASFAGEYTHVLSGRFVFTFVRYPLTWWQSYWAHRFLHGWSPDHPMDRVCNDNDFCRYMEQILRSDWKRHYLDLCSTFVTERTDFVGRQENLVADLTVALGRAGEKFDRKSLGRLGFTNRSLSDEARYTASLRREVKALHRDVIRRFYPEKDSVALRYFERMFQKQ